MEGETNRARPSRSASQMTSEVFSAMSRYFSSSLGYLFCICLSVNVYSCLFFNGLALAPDRIFADCQRMIRLKIQLPIILIKNGGIYAFWQH